MGRHFTFSKYLVKLWVLTSFAACDDNFMKSRVSDRTSTVKLMASSTDSSGNISTSFDPSSTETQVLKAGAGKVAGAALAMPQGALSIPISVTIGEGSSLVTSASTSDIGLESGSATAAGPSVSFVPSAAVEANAAFTLSIPISTTSTLALGTDVNAPENMVVLYRVSSIENGKTVYAAGLIPKRDLTMTGKSVQFQSTKFGTFQVATTDVKIEEKIVKKVNTAPALKSALTAPSALSYTFPTTTLLVGLELPTILPTLKGDRPDFFTVNPELPAGLTLNRITGVITGKPTAASLKQSYTISAGNEAGITGFTITLESVSTLIPPRPTVAITPPSSLATNQSPQTLQVVFSESVTDVTVEDVLVTGSATATISGSDKNYILTLTHTANGSITVKIKDKAALGVSGQYSTESAEVTYGYDTTNPVVSLTSINPNSPSAVLDPVVKGTVSEAGSVILYKLSDCTSPISNPISSSDFQTTGVSLVGITTDGNTDVYAKATDLAGNSVCSFLVTYTSDAVPPASISISIGAGAYTSSSTLVLNLTATDTNSGIEVLLTESPACGSGGYTTYFSSMNFTVSGDGNHTIYAKFKDSFGNESACIQASVIVDTQAPGSFNFTAPSVWSSFTTLPTFSWTTPADVSPVTYALKTGSTSGCSSWSSGNLGASTSYTLTTPLTGSTYVCVVATDALGNVTPINNYYTLLTAPFSCDSGSWESNCIISSAKSVSVNTSVTLNTNFTVGSGGTINVTNGATLSITMPGYNFTVENGGTISGNFNLIAANLNVATTGVITADGKGFAGGSAGFSGLPSDTSGGGKYSATCAGGGAHGGFGGSFALSILQTILPGQNDFSGISNGGSGSANSSNAGGNAGGNIDLIISGQLTLAGTISALGSNGTNGSGGGAGGFIRMDVGNFGSETSGLIDASGGGGSSYACSGSVNESGGGGGGRIKIRSSNKYRGMILVKGGGTDLRARGGDGTFFQQLTGTNPYCDSYNSGTGVCTISSRTWVGNNEQVEIAGSLELTGASNSLQLASSNQADYDGPVNAAYLRVSGSLTVNSGHTWDPDDAQRPLGFGFAQIEANTIVVNGMMRGNFPLILANTVTVGNSAIIHANGRGHRGGVAAAGSGPFGGGGSSGGGMCGAGGAGGGASGGAAGESGNVMPMTFGSGGGSNVVSVTGGAGGGLIKIVARTGLNFTDSVGFISANGMAASGTGGYGGGGAGGSIIIDAGTIASSSSNFSAQGGSGLNSNIDGGGGGGGCVRFFKKDATTVTANVDGALWGTYPGSSGSSMTKSMTSDFRRIFVAATTFSTSTLSPAASVTGLDGACTGEASGAGIGGAGITWKALLSSNSGTPATSLNTTSPMILNARGELLKAAGTTLFAALMGPVKYDPFGVTVPAAADIFTGSTSAGGISSNCNHLADSTSGSSYSVSSPVDSSSSWFSSASRTCNQDFRIYCISQ
jgi:hypothetical protein